jgi:hypothetical protein
MGWEKLGFAVLVISTVASGLTIEKKLSDEAIADFNE